MTKSPVKQKYRSLRRNEITGKTKVSSLRRNEEQLTVNTRYNELGNLAIFLEHMVLFCVVTTVHQDGRLFADSIFCLPAFVRPSYAMY